MRAHNRIDVDIAIIGAGVVGAAIARELTGFAVSVALVEARADVGEGTSKANTALLHTGFDAYPGTLEARLVRRGFERLRGYAPSVGIPIERTGAVVVAWTPDEHAKLPELLATAVRNGYRGCALLDHTEVYRRIPNLNSGVLAGLAVPDESITCTWTTPLAFATEARKRGAALRLGHRVDAVTVRPEGTVLHSSAGDIGTRWVVNAAGLYCDVVDRMFGDARFALRPRRGELIVFDKHARSLVDTIVLAVPSAAGKGVLITPTVYGNVLLGPTAEDVTDRDDTATTPAGLEILRRKGAELMPRLLEEDVTALYAGVRAGIDRPDYLIEVDPERRYALVAGIRSTGLTSSMAIAEYVRDQLDQAGLRLIERQRLPPPPRLPNLGEAFPRPYQDGPRIAADPAYGRVVCFCERVTQGELRDALASTIPPAGLAGLRRRTRVMNGRCQGFYCGADVAQLLGDHGDHRR
jgi:glycerol-3-phosphate dehydrogenase